MDPIGLRILTVDDDELVLMTIGFMLEDLGHDVFTAPSATEALEILNNRQIDLLITDYIMPGMNGMELIIQARSLIPNMPVILASGYSDAIRDLDLSISKLVKPFDQMHVSDAISRLIIS